MNYKGEIFEYTYFIYLQIFIVYFCKNTWREQLFNRHKAKYLD